ncbi:hypothetical protein VNO78_23366 [Psophocarpus tetragonolobus]|uniref:Uncharacterized protein n=1 Tax=Psophocarpus tetragonolobus TaxID=3891 RepID=A0AAN9S3L1_PSOTE
MSIHHKSLHVISNLTVGSPSTSRSLRQPFQKSFLKKCFSKLVLPSSLLPSPVSRLPSPHSPLSTSNNKQPLPIFPFTLPNPDFPLPKFPVWIS